MHVAGRNVAGQQALVDIAFLGDDQVLEIAVVLSALSGGFTCIAVLVLFLGEVRGDTTAKLLFLSFGGAIVLTMAALGAFVIEMLLTARVLRRTVDRNAGT